MEVLVLFNYDGQADDELTIRKGDVILDVKKQDGGWWEGLLGSKRGVFPDNFVTVVSEAEMNTPLIRTEKGRKCKVLFSYNPTHEDELALLVGDEIQLLGEVEEGWWRGRLSGRVGVFPSNFVSVTDNALSAVENVKTNGDTFSTTATPTATPTPTPSTPLEMAPKLPPKPVREMARVLYSYSALQPDELELKEGDLVIILVKDCEDKGWWKGELNGKVGVFPDNFVELIPQVNSGPAKPDRPPVQALSPVASSKAATPQLRSSLNVSEPAIPISNLPVRMNGVKNATLNPSNDRSSSLSDEQKLLQVGEIIDLSNVITPTALLAHPARVKPAKRRPPSSIFLKDIESNNGATSPSTNSNTSTVKEEPDTPLAVATTEPMQAPVPKGKTPSVTPPWIVELKKNQEKRGTGTQQEPKTASSSTKADLPAVAYHTKPVLASSHGVAKKSLSPSVSVSSTKNTSTGSSPRLSGPTTNKQSGLSGHQLIELEAAVSKLNNGSERVVNNLNGSDHNQSINNHEIMSNGTSVHQEVFHLRHRVSELEGTVQCLQEELLRLKSLVEGPELHL